MYVIENQLFKCFSLEIFNAKKKGFCNHFSSITKRNRISNDGFNSHGGVFKIVPRFFVFRKIVLKIAVVCISFRII